MPPPLRILHTIDSSGIYGAESMLFNLAAEQDGTEVEPVILSIGNPYSGEKAIEVEARRRGVACIPLRMRDGPNLAGARQLLQIARAQRIDVIHSHGYKSNILLGALPRTVRDIPVLTTLHGWTATRTLSKLGLYRLIDQLLLPRLDAVVLVNDALRQQPAIARLRAGSVHHIANGVPLVGTGAGAAANDALSAEIAALRSDGGFVIGAIGRLSKEKNFSALIDAVDRLRADLPQLRVVILGDGPERAALEAQVRERGLQQQIFLKGYCAAAQRYLGGFDLFVLPSLTEGLPMVLLEAMAVSIPLVATAVGGIPALVKDPAALVPPGDIAALANAIAAAVADPAGRAERARLAQQRVADHYSAAAMARSYQKLYRTLIR